jgi:hypothetical protein
MDQENGWRENFLNVTPLESKNVFKLLKSSGEVAEMKHTSVQWFVGPFAAIISTPLIFRMFTFSTARMRQR